MRKSSFYSLILCVAVTSFGCGGSAAENQTSTAMQNNNGAANAASSNKPEPQKNATTPFEKALFSIRVGEFDQVLVVRRKDGGEFDEADKDFLRNNQPSEPGRQVNRWVRCDDNKCFIAGTNFPFTRENLIALQSRFDVKDFSQSDAGTEVKLPDAANNQKTEQGLK